MSELREHPGLDLAGLLIQQSATGGCLRNFIDEALAVLGPVGDSGLDAAQYRLLCEFVDTQGDALKRADEILKKVDDINDTERVTHIPTRGIPELYPAGRPRGNGIQLEHIDEVVQYPAIYTFDVLQQAPEVLAKDVDQIHIVAKKEAAPSRDMPDGQWAPLSEEIETVDVGGLHVNYNICEEDVMIELESVQLALLDTNNIIVGREDTVLGVNDYTADAIRQVVMAAGDFKRHGTQVGCNVMHLKVDSVSPKIDGCPLYIDIGGRKSQATSRIGDKFEARIVGRFEKELRAQRRVKMLVEAYPNVREPEAFFLLQAWIFGIPNETGRKYMEQLIKRKNIQISLKGRVYDLKFPTFLNVPPDWADGAVLHCRTFQYFCKPRSTIDVQTEETKRHLERNFNVSCDWRDGLWEYAVHPSKVDKTIELIPLRVRWDKLRENQITNIEDVLTSPDLYSVIDMLNRGDDDEDMPGHFIPDGYFEDNEEGPEYDTRE